jgi:hypothetical protein
VTDASDRFVKTLLVRGNDPDFRSRLYKWLSMSSGNVTDAVTGASFNTRNAAQDHGLRTATWNCRDASGAIVPDGTYRIWVDMNESNSDNHDVFTYVQFTKDGSNHTATAADLRAYTAANNGCDDGLTSTQVTVFSSLQVTYRPANTGAAARHGSLRTSDAQRPVALFGLDGRRVAGEALLSGPGRVFDVGSGASRQTAFTIRVLQGNAGSRPAVLVVE